MSILGKVENPNSLKNRRDTYCLRPQKNKEQSTKAKGNCC